jgi:molybdopterin-guanine dinucleotide biosynthesis protein A
LSHEGVLFESLLAERVEDAADAAVEGADHGGVDPLAMQLDVRQRLVVLARRLQRGMRRPMGEVEEEGTVPVGLDDLDRFVGVVVGEVAGGLEAVSAVVAGREV